MAAHVLAFTPRQLNITLPESMASELEAIADKNGWSMEELVSTALGLLKLASDTAASRNKLVIADESDKPLREVVVFRSR